MKYHETLARAHENLSNTVLFLEKHRLAPNPINYTVAYEYVSGTNTELAQSLNEHIKHGMALDDYLMESFYTQFVVKPDSSNEQIVDDVSSVIGDVDQATSGASASLSKYLDSLDNGLVILDENSPETSREAISRLIDMTCEVKRNQQKLNQALKEAKQQTDAIQKQLDDAKQEAKQDPLTGLYHFASMQDEVEMWLMEQPNRSIAAIAIDIDDFSEFNTSFGYLVGDVVISKVARKIRNYCQDSGLPVRVGGEEFLILIPDTDVQTAGEIAEQVRQGVEKIRFVSSKSKRRLPKVTISLGVSNYDIREDWQQFLSRMNGIVNSAKVKGKNQVITMAYQ